MRTNECLSLLNASHLFLTPQLGPQKLDAQGIYYVIYSKCNLDNILQHKLMKKTQKNGTLTGKRDEILTPQAWQMPSKNAPNCLLKSCKLQQ